MLDKVRRMEERFREIDELLVNPDVLRERSRLIELSRERRELEPVVAKSRELSAVLRSIADNEALLADAGDTELAELARSELDELAEKRERLTAELRELLRPRDPYEDKNTVVEIRAGTGGEEAALFAADLFRMYQRFAERQGWKTEMLSSSETELGGVREAVFLVQGKGAFGKLRFEGGTHRVQRVPATEQSGRIHTSAATVAVLPEADEVEVNINPEELRIDVYRSSGAGGQHVNTTDSAVRITHIPSGMVVTCQDERSQHKNRAKAMKIMAARLLDRAREEQDQSRSAARRQMLGSGDRSEKIRTYNFPQNRVTDHRIGFSMHNLSAFMDGDLDDLFEALRSSYEEEGLKAGS